MPARIAVDDSKRRQACDRAGNQSRRVRIPNGQVCRVRVARRTATARSIWLVRFAEHRSRLRSAAESAAPARVGLAVGGRIADTGGRPAGSIRSRSVAGRVVDQQSLAVRGARSGRRCCVHRADDTLAIVSAGTSSLRRRPPTWTRPCRCHRSWLPLSRALVRDDRN